MPGDFRAAFGIVWVILSGISLGLIAAPWIVTPDQVAAVVPKCEWKVRYGRECFLCGMTTAFFDIAGGRFREAERSNRGSVPLYAGLIGNEFTVIWFLRKRARSC